MNPAWLAFLALTACSTSVFDSGSSGAACSGDSDCGTGAYCELPLASCASGGEIATGAGACHRSCANGACSCLSDADCPGGSCNSGTCNPNHLLPGRPLHRRVPGGQSRGGSLWRLPLLHVPQPDGGSGETAAAARMAAAATTEATAEATTVGTAAMMAARTGEVARPATATRIATAARIATCRSRAARMASARWWPTLESVTGTARTTRVFALPTLTALPACATGVTARNPNHCLSCAPLPRELPGGQAGRGTVRGLPLLHLPR